MNKFLIALIIGDKIDAYMHDWHHETPIMTPNTKYVFEADMFDLNEAQRRRQHVQSDWDKKYPNDDWWFCIIPVDQAQDLIKI